MESHRTEAITVEEIQSVWVWKKDGAYIPSHNSYMISALTIDHIPFYSLLKTCKEEENIAHIMWRLSGGYSLKYT